MRNAPCFVIERGLVDFLDRRPDEDVWFARQDHSFIGDIAMFTGEPTIAACVAAAPTDVIAFDRTQLRHMAAKWPEFGELVLRTMTARPWLEGHGVGVLRTFVAEAWAPGGQAGTSMRIENYLGFPTGITGTDLTRKATLQAQRFDAVLSSFHEAVEIVDGPDGAVRVDLDDGQHVVARTLLVATGALRRDSLGRTMSRYLLERIERAPNIEIVPRSEISAVHGNGTLESVSLVDAGNGHTERVEAVAVFVMIGADPCTEAVGSMLAVDEAGFLLCGAAAREHDGERRWSETSRDPFLLETVRPGVFAAGWRRPVGGDEARRRRCGRRRPCRALRPSAPRPLSSHEPAKGAATKATSEDVASVSWKAATERS